MTTQIAINRLILKGRNAKHIILIYFLFIIKLGLSQLTKPDFKTKQPTTKIIPYEYIREADLIWSKRVWQYVDLREKINFPLYYPFDTYNSQGNWQVDSENLSLWSILKLHILTGELTLFSAYNPVSFSLTDGDQLKYPIYPESGKDFYSDGTFRNQLFPYFGTLDILSSIPISNSYGEDSSITQNGITTYIYPSKDTIWLVSKDIIQYRIKEDWFFDKERSVLDVRIIALAPVIYIKDEQGQITGMKELFWLYFPHCRFYLNNFLVFNDQNDAQRISFDDLFWKRRFNGTIYKESNVYDRKLEMYTIGIDAIIKAEKIKEEIRTIEHDIWNF